MLIAKVSEKCDISIATLRYYERIGLIPYIKRNEKGVRDYTEDDYELICFIKSMRNAGFSIETLIEYATIIQKETSIIIDRRNLLVKCRNQIIEKIEEVQQIMKGLNNIIDEHEKRGMKDEKQLIKENE